MVYRTSKSNQTKPPVTNTPVISTLPLPESLCNHGPPPPKKKLPSSTSLPLGSSHLPPLLHILTRPSSFPCSPLSLVGYNNMMNANFCKEKQRADSQQNQVLRANILMYTCTLSQTANLSTY